MTEMERISHEYEYNICFGIKDLLDTSCYGIVNFKPQLSFDREDSGGKSSLSTISIRRHLHRHWRQGLVHENKSHTHTHTYLWACYKTNQEYSTNSRKSSWKALIGEEVCHRSWMCFRIPHLFLWFFLRNVKDCWKETLCSFPSN